MTDLAIRPSEYNKYLCRDQLPQIDEAIAAGRAYERVLAAKQFRVRKAILNLEVMRDAVEALGKATWRGVA